MNSRASAAPRGRSGSALLDAYERLSREELRAMQWSRLQRQLARISRDSVFYRDKLARAGVRLDGIRSLEEFSERFPTSSKAEFLRDQTEHPPYGSRLSVPPRSVALINMTGGTSGQGQEVYGRTHHDIAMQGFLHYLPWYLAGLRPGHVALNCVPQGGLTTGGWGPPEGFRVAGVAAINAPAAYSTDAKIDLILRFGRLDFIYASTNFLHTLTDRMRQRGVLPARAFPGMAGILIAAEGYPRRWAEAMVEQWGCPLHEGYGSTQGAGFIASTCEHGVVRRDGRPGHLHVFEWEQLVEVVDPESGRPVAPGEEGEIVLTNLSILGSPVVRFATGDKARFLGWESCGCGRRWSCIEAGSIGRYDDMMKIRGNNVWPAAVDTVVFSHPEIAEYIGRVYVDEHGRTEVDLRYALKPDASQEPAAVRALEMALGQAIKAATNVTMRLKVVPRSELPVFEYKARRWSDERRAGYASLPQAVPREGSHGRT